jgi:hypothetical protein
MDCLRPRSRSRDWRASLAKPLVQDQPQRLDITVWPNVVPLRLSSPVRHRHVSMPRFAGLLRQVRCKNPNVEKLYSQASCSRGITQPCSGLSPVMSRNR